MHSDFNIFFNILLISFSCCEPFNVFPCICYSLCPSVSFSFIWQQNYIDFFYLIQVIFAFFFYLSLSVYVIYIDSAYTEVIFCCCYCCCCCCFSKLNLENTWRDNSSRWVKIFMYRDTVLKELVEGKRGDDFMDYH